MSEPTIPTPDAWREDGRRPDRIETKDFRQRQAAAYRRLRAANAAVEAAEQELEDARRECDEIEREFAND